MRLEENREKILELQAVEGKILSAKDLRSLCGSFVIFFGVLIRIVVQMGEVKVI